LDLEVASTSSPATKSFLRTPSPWARCVHDCHWLPANGLWLFLRPQQVSRLSPSLLRETETYEKFDQIIIPTPPRMWPMLEVWGARWWKVLRRSALIGEMIGHKVYYPQPPRGRCPKMAAFTKACCQMALCF